jgi:zeaxanthin epoxidase
LIRSAAVQGLSRFASDIIIRGFDTPAKIVRNETTGEIQFQNFNYAGIVTKMLQPILPIFFMVQFNFLYDGYQNKKLIDIPAFVAFTVLGGLVLLVLSFELAEVGLGVGIGAEALLGAEGILDFEAIMNTLRGLFPFLGA